jgi:cold shock CspA family protein
MVEESVFECAATVTSWHKDEGWGTIRLDEDGTEVWVHFSAVDGPPTSYRSLVVGQRVMCRYEIVDQDGYDARAVKVTKLLTP